MKRLLISAIMLVVAGAAFAAEPVKVLNLLPPLNDEDDPRSEHRLEAGALPIVVPPFWEHVRESVAGLPDGKIVRVAVDGNGALLAVSEAGTVLRRGQDGQWSPAEAGAATPAALREVQQGSDHWKLSDGTLYLNGNKVESFGVDGPLASRVTALALDSKGTLWVGTPLGLSLRAADGTWTQVRGKQGLPYEDVTALAFDAQDNLWIGTTGGAILHKPYAEGRKWFYRAGLRYLLSDKVLDVAVTPDGSIAYFATEAGPSAIRAKTTTLLEKAQTIERILNERHRRFDLVAEGALDDAQNPTTTTIDDNDNDGLWTAYHVAAMSLCYGATGDPAAKESARRSMHALYMLQNVSGIPGLVARSVVPPEIGKTKNAQWRPTADGKFYWKSDTSSDEIDGHYMAFYTYWTHIAKNDPAERDLCIKQVRDVTNYIVDNGYQLIDWDGERTTWGFWDPKSLNDEPMRYLETGLNSLEILSFLKTAYTVSGDSKFERHYQKLIRKHHYLNNIMLSKKVFPDMNNHSDDQLGYVAWYPILQAETDPSIKQVLTAAVRRHYKIVRPEKPSWFTFVTGTVDPNYVYFEDAAENLREIPTDRRMYPTVNAQRADVIFDPSVDRFEKRQLIHVLPADERAFGKWNRNPYLPDDGGSELSEDDGAAYLLPYWMGRYHGFIAEAGK